MKGKTQKKDKSIGKGEEQINLKTKGIRSYQSKKEKQNNKGKGEVRINTITHPSSTSDKFHFETHTYNNRKA